MRVQSVSFPSGSVIRIIRGLWILVGVGLAFMTTPSSRVFNNNRVPTGDIPTTLIKIFSKIGSKAALLFFFKAEDGIRDVAVLEFRRVLFRSRRRAAGPQGKAAPESRPSGGAGRPF